jgi:hypothetical protein
MGDPFFVRRLERALQETVMANQCSSSFRSFLKSSMIFAVASILLSPLAAFGESMAFIRTAATSQENFSTLQNDSLKKVRLTLDNEGNVIVRYGGVSCTFIYGVSSPLESKGHPVLAPSGSQVASLGGICLKIGITF